MEAILFPGLSRPGKRIASIGGMWRQIRIYENMEPQQSQVLHPVIPDAPKMIRLAGTWLAFIRRRKGLKVGSTISIRNSGIQLLQDKVTDLT